MAIVTTAFSPDGEPFAYSGLTDIARSSGVGASGELSFQEIKGTVLLSGAGDNQRVNVTCDCPPNFAYALQSCYMAIEAQTAATDIGFPDMCEVKIQNANAETDATQLIPFELISSGQAGTRATNTFRKSYGPRNLASVIVIPLVGDNVSMTADFVNQTANDQAYEIYFYARFLRFTIDQANHYRVNSPIPVR